MILLKGFLVAFIVSSLVSFLIYRYVFNETSLQTIIVSLVGGIGCGLAILILAKKKIIKKP